MSKGFPLSWETWREGVAEAYRLKKELDKRAAAGEVLFNDERRTHQRVSDIVARYFPSGRKRPGAPRRGRSGESMGSSVIAHALQPGHSEVIWRSEIDSVDWRSETGIDA